MLRLDLNDLVILAHIALMVDERQLKTDTGIEVVEEVAPAFKDGVFILVLRQLVVDVVESDSFGMADISHVPLTYLQPDQSLFIERAAEAYGKKGKIEAQHLAFELTELFASGDLTPQDMDGIMYEMHKAYFKYREQKREKERIMNL